MKRYTKEEINRLDAVDVYKMVLRGDIIKRFTKGFWQRPEAQENAYKCSKNIL